MDEQEIRQNERQEVRNVFGYAKRALKKDNPDRPSMDYLLDWLLTEIEANWSLCDAFREAGIKH